MQAKKFQEKMPLLDDALHARISTANFLVSCNVFLTKNMK